MNTDEDEKNMQLSTYQEHNKKQRMEPKHENIFQPSNYQESQRRHPCHQKKVSSETENKQADNGLNIYEKLLHLYFFSNQKPVR